MKRDTHTYTDRENTGCRITTILFSFPFVYVCTITGLLLIKFLVS